MLTPSQSQRLGFHAWSIELDRPVSVEVHKGKANFRRSPSANSGLVADVGCDGSLGLSGLGATPTGLSLSPTTALKAAPLPSLVAAKSGATSTGHKTAVDVPMRSFQGGYYPLLIALYTHLGLPLAPQRFTFSFSALRTRGHAHGHGHAGRAALRPADTYFIHAGSSGVSRPSLPGRAWASPLALVRAVVDFVVVAICYLALLVTAFLSWHGRLPKAWGSDATFAQVVDGVAHVLDRPHRWVHTRLGPRFKAFAADIVLPLFSAVGTMTADDVWATPAHYVLDYIHAGAGTSHYAVGGGRSARDVAQSLAAPIRAQGDDHVRLGTAIRSIRYRAATATVAAGLTLSLDGGDELDVDRVVIATQASAARALLAGLEASLVVGGARTEARRVARMRTALAEVRYRDTIVATHRDASVLPHALDVRDINLVQPQAHTQVAGGATESTDINISIDTPPLTPTRSRSASSSPCPSPPNPPAQLASGPAGMDVDVDVLGSGTPYFSPTDAVYTMATHVIATPTGPVYQTTNPVVPIDSSSVLGVARLERALPLRDAAKTLAGLRPPSSPTASMSVLPSSTSTDHPPQPAPLIHLAGSYAYPGIPLLEGCVGSARRAAEDICGLPAAAAVGGVDWDAGRGSVWGRAWRWRQARRGGYF